jgi:hypothetical protein
MFHEVSPKHEPVIVGEGELGLINNSFGSYIPFVVDEGPYSTQSSRPFVVHCVPNDHSYRQGYMNSLELSLRSRDYGARIIKL